MQIYLAKPGGPKEGPYSLEKINADLAARKYKDDDYWAWHEGLTAWVPLYSVGGVGGAADTTFFFAKPAAKGAPTPVKPPEAPSADTTIFLAKPPFYYEFAAQSLPGSDHAPVVTSSGTVVVTKSTSEQPQPCAKPQAAEAKPSCVAKPCPEPGQAAAVNAAPPSADTATPVSGHQESATPVGPSTPKVVVAAQTRPTLEKPMFPAHIPSADRKVSAASDPKGQECQTQGQPSAPGSITWVADAVVPEQPKSGRKKAVSARKRSASPGKSGNGKSKVRAQAQVAKSPKPFPIPNRRALAARGGEPLVST